MVVILGFFICRKETLTRILTIAVLLSALYSNAGPPPPSTLLRETDGGWANRVWCDGVEVSGGGSGVYNVNAVIDGGSVSVNNFPASQAVTGTVTCNVSNPTPTYVNVLVDGGWISSTIINRPYVDAFVAFDAGYVSVANPITYVNALVDGGHITATVINQYTSYDAGYVSVANIYRNVLLDGGWTTVTVINRPYVDSFVAFDGGYVSVMNPVSYNNVLIDGGHVTATVINQYTSFDGGWVSVMNFPATQPVSGPLTDAQLRAAVVPVSLTSTTITGTVAATQSGVWTNTVTQATGTNLHVVVDSAPTTAVTGPVTDAQIRATPLPVSGTVTATVASTTITGTVTVSNPTDTALTDTQLRASAVPISGTVTASGPVTNTELRATPVIVYAPLQPRIGLFPSCNKIRKTGCQP